MSSLQIFITIADREQDQQLIKWIRERAEREDHSLNRTCRGILKEAMERDVSQNKQKESRSKTTLD